MSSRAPARAPASRWRSSGTWWTWDTASGAYTDTGLTAEGKDGNVLFATFAVDPATGLLSMTTPDGYAGPEFALNNGYLEVTVNA